MSLKITPQQLATYRRADYAATGVGGLILNELLDDIELMIQALCEIGYTDHCQYDKNECSDYGKGVTDGHRCAATIARDVFNDGHAFIADENEWRKHKKR